MNEAISQVEVVRQEVVPIFKKDTLFICDQCGIEFERNPLQVKGKMKFCSYSCHNQFMKGRQLKPPHKRDRTGFHVLIAEKVLGKKVPKGAVIHHINGNDKDNHISNLLICQDAAYHRLIHKRMRIVNAGGHPSTDRICSSCKKLKSISEFDPSDFRKSGRCIPCKREDTKRRKHDGNYYQFARGA